MTDRISVWLVDDHALVRRAPGDHPTLALRINTVAAHRTSIMKALRVHRVADLATHVIRHGRANVP